MSAAPRSLAQAIEDTADAIQYADWTDPEGLDIAEMLADVRDARERLHELERTLEHETGRAMLGPNAENPTIRVERHRRPERKKWQHDEWKTEVRRKIIQAANLKGATVISRDGEELEISLYELLRKVQDVHGSTDPRVTRLRALGIEPDDFCTREPGTWKVDITRLADENLDWLREELTGTSSTAD